MTGVEWVLLALVALGLAFMAWAASYSVAQWWRDRWRRRSDGAARARGEWHPQ